MKRYFPSIKHYSWIVVVCLLLTATAGFLVAKSQPIAYSANATLLVNSGAPGTTYAGNSATSSDSIFHAANDAAEIPTRSVMEFVYHSDPQLKTRGYGPFDLMLDVTVAAPSTTTSTLVLTATTTKPGDAVLVVNDAAKGYQAYKQAQVQSALDQMRQSLQNQYNTYQTQSNSLEAKILSYGTSNDPHIALYTVDRNTIIQAMNLLQTQLLALPANVLSDVFIMQLATITDVTSTSKAALITAVTAAVGLVLGILVMLLMVFFDDRLRGDDLVKEKLGFAYLGGLSTNSQLKSSPTKASGVTRQEVADIGINLRLTKVLPAEWGAASRGATLLITSVQVAEGKTTLAASLAASVARGGGTVVVVDGNLRKPSTHLAFDINPGGMGLSGLFKAAGSETVDSVVQRSNIPGVWLLPAGAALDDPTFLLGKKFADILTHLRKKTDLVIVDGPALLNGSDAALLATMVDGVALVLDCRHDKLPLLLRAKEILTSLTDTPVGVVLNHMPKRKQNRYYASAPQVGTTIEQRAPAPTHVSNGNGKHSGSGEQVEQMVAFPAIPPSPGPAPAIKASSAPSGTIPPGRPNPTAGSTKLEPPQSMTPNPPPPRPGYRARRDDMSPPPLQRLSND